MDFKIKQGESLSEEAIQEMIDLDRSAYGDQVITDEGLAYRRFEKFKDGLIAAFFEDELAGFVCFYSVNESVYDEAINKQKVFDDNLQVSDLQALSASGKNIIEWLDLNVKERFRNRGLASYLYKQIGLYMIEKEKKGFAIDKMFAYAYTGEGFKILKNLGGHVVWERDGITLMDLDPAIFMELSQ